MKQYKFLQTLFIFSTLSLSFCSDLKNDSSNASSYSRGEKFSLTMTSSKKRKALKAITSTIYSTNVSPSKKYLRTIIVTVNGAKNTTNLGLEIRQSDGITKTKTDHFEIGKPNLTEDGQGIEFWVDSVSKEPRDLAGEYKIVALDTSTNKILGSIPFLITDFEIRTVTAKTTESAETAVYNFGNPGLASLEGLTSFLKNEYCCQKPIELSEDTTQMLLDFGPKHTSNYKIFVTKKGAQDEEILTTTNQDLYQAILIIEKNVKYRVLVNSHAPGADSSSAEPVASDMVTFIKK